MVDLDKFLKEQLDLFPQKDVKPQKGPPVKADNVPNEAELIEQSPEYKAFDHNVKLMVVSNSQNKLVGNVKLEDETITFYLHEGMSLDNINKIGLFKSWQARAESDVIPTFAVVTLNVDPSKQRTCRFFTANEEYINSTPASESEEYDFDKPHADQSVCMNPKISKDYGIPNPPCHEEQVMSNCSYYESESFIPLSEVVLKKGDQREILRVSDSRVGYGLPVYKIDNDDREIARILHMDLDVDIREEIEAAATDYAEVEGAVVDEIVDVDFDKQEMTIQKRYFEYVTEEE